MSAPETHVTACLSETSAAQHTHTHTHSIIQRTWPDLIFLQVKLYDDAENWRRNAVFVREIALMCERMTKKEEYKTKLM